jgi:3-oxoacyl-[acyl-carrier protein] reductase
MDLELKDKLFVVTGASSGMGKAIAMALLKEGAHVIINARGEEKLNDIAKLFPDKTTILPGDITTDATIANVFRKIGNRRLDGILINAGGPPAKSFLETDMSDWDEAFQNVLRWKVKLTHEVLDKLRPQLYGRILFIESASVKQPIENLVLSNSMRLAVVGFVKTLSQEIAHEGITLNVLAPGYHETPAMERLYIKKAMLLGMTPDAVRKEFESETRVGKLGNPDDLSALALYLLSPQSSFITGQTISVDGGLVKSTMG